MPFRYVCSRKARTLSNDPTIAATNDNNLKYERRNKEIELYRGYSVENVVKIRRPHYYMFDREKIYAATVTRILNRQ